MLNLVGRTVEFVVLVLLLRVADRCKRLLPTHGSDTSRLLRENLALKAQVTAMAAELRNMRKRPKLSAGTRAAQVFASIVTGGDRRFATHYITASRATVTRWKKKLSKLFATTRGIDNGGRPPLPNEILQLILRFKKDNPLWGAARIRLQLRWLGIRISEPTIQKKLREHGFDPTRGPRFNFNRYRSEIRDLAWAMDFFVIRNLKGHWMTIFVTIDLHTRELIDLRAKDGWFPDAIWTIRAFVAMMRRCGRRPDRVVHDRGAQFLGQFMRQVSVLEIEQRPIPPCLPVVNGIAERVIKTIRIELTNHIRPKNAEDLQIVLDKYIQYYNRHRPHQGIEGSTPVLRDEPGPESVQVLSMEDIRARKLIRETHVSGLLHSYDWELRDAA